MPDVILLISHEPLILVPSWLLAHLRVFRWGSLSDGFTLLAGLKSGALAAKRSKPTQQIHNGFNCTNFTACGLTILCQVKQKRRIMEAVLIWRPFLLGFQRR
jgi:hypothetical protein